MPGDYEGQLQHRVRSLVKQHDVLSVQLQKLNTELVLERRRVQRDEELTYDLSYYFYYIIFILNFLFKKKRKILFLNGYFYLFC